MHGARTSHTKVCSFHICGRWPCREGSRETSNHPPIFDDPHPGRELQKKRGVKGWSQYACDNYATATHARSRSGHQECFIPCVRARCQQVRTSEPSSTIVRVCTPDRSLRRNLRLDTEIGGRPPLDRANCPDCSRVLARFRALAYSCGI